MIFRKQKQPVLQNSQSGFTIMECLLAIIIVSILMTAIAPVIALSVANRVQSRRMEVATNAAKAYIEGIKSGAIPPPNYVVTVNEVTTTTSGGVTTKNFDSQRSTFTSVAAPSTTLPTCTTPTKGYCNDPNAAANSTTMSLYCVSRDNNAGCSNDSYQDLIIQSFRSVYTTTSGGVTTTNDNPAEGYLLGIRVYRADGFTTTNGNLKTLKANSVKQYANTGGMGFSKIPLLEMTAEISSAQTKYKNYCDRFGGCQ